MISVMLLDKISEFLNFYKKKKAINLKNSLSSRRYGYTNFRRHALMRTDHFIACGIFTCTGAHA